MCCPQRRVGYQHATSSGPSPVMYRLKHHEAFEPGLQRVMLALLLQASGEAAADDTPETSRIHVVRKRLKRARAIHKLARPALDEARYRREQAWFRDRGRRLSQARDVDVLLETYVRLARRSAGITEADNAGDPVRSALHGLRYETHLDSPPSRLLGEVAEELMVNAREWDTVFWVPTQAHLIRDALTPGIGRYASALDDVESGQTVERFHTLRKRVKDLGYQMDFMVKRVPAAGKRLRRRADRLGELLGWHHDVWVFADRVAAMEELPAVVRHSWQRLAEAEGKRVEQRALAKADNLRRAIARKVGER